MTDPTDDAEPLLGNCEQCGKPGAELGVNPYEAEVNDDDSPCFLCKDCFRQLWEDS